MLINIPNQLTSEEEQLLKKIAKMKKKKKLFLEKKASIKDSQQEAQTANTASTAVKRTSTGTPNVKQPQIDAKEAAKKLIQSGVIKLETESKDKGFKRSCSRKDDSRKPNLTHQQSFDSNKATYSSGLNSPMSAKSPPFSPGSNPFFNSNKFSSSDSNSSNPSKYTRSPSFNNNQNNNFRRNSFQNNFNNQTPITGGNNNIRYNNNNNNFHHHNNQNGFSLYVKANNVNEELLRSIFNANISSAKILSIDVKTNFAFVMLDSKEAAETAIQELNGKIFQDSLFSVSFARPKKQFNRNNSYQPNYERNNSFNMNNPHNQNNNINLEFNNQGGTMSSNLNASLSPTANEQQQSNAQRQVINYEDI